MFFLVFPFFFLFRIKFFLSSSYCRVVQEQLEKKSKVLYIEKWPKCVLFVSRRHFLCIKKSNAWRFLDHNGFLRFWTPFFWSTVVAFLSLIYLCRCRKLGTLHSTLPAAGASHLVCGRGEKLHFAKLNPKKKLERKKENWSNEAVDIVSFVHARSQATDGSYAWYSQNAFDCLDQFQ